MNKKKIAVFVEGLTEQIFLREMLNVWFEYNSNKLGVKCYSLRSDKLHDAPYDIGNKDSEFFYQIINVGNDESVLSKMLHEVERLVNQGYTTIIGLRDMYSDRYKEMSEGRGIVCELNEKFIHGAQDIIKERKLQNTVHLCFAIMEIEAWFIGMETLFLSIDRDFSQAEIHRLLGIDITQDPETSYFHPYVTLCKILNIKGIEYNKHESDISSLLSKLTKTDYELLLDSPKCQSFKTFMKLLVNDIDI